MPAPVVPLAVFAPLALFALYRRARRNIGRQPLRHGRLVARVVLFALVGALLLVPAVLSAGLGWGAAAGLGGGALLGLAGLHLAHVESTTEGWFYTPNRYLGFALTALLAGRLAYRFVRLGGGLPPVAAAGGGWTGTPQSALTLALAGLLVGYYLVFYAGLLWRARGPGTPAGIH